MKNKRWILSCETSSSTGSVAIGFEEAGIHRCLIKKSWSKKSSHNEVLLSEIDQLLKSANVTLSDLQSLALGLGPGSFTGVRIGINLIKTLSYILKLPILGVSSLKLISVAVRKTLDNQSIAIIQNAFSNQYYCRFERSPQEITSDVLLSAEQIGEKLIPSMLLIGNGASTLLSKASNEVQNLQITNQVFSPCASDFFDLLNSNCSSVARFKSWKELQPLYLKASTAEEKLRTGELKKQHIF